MTQISIGITEQDRRKVSEILGAVLADSYILYTKTRGYHWNVVGPHFAEYHEMFEGQYTKLESEIDEVAERIRALGFKVSASASEFVKSSQIQEKPDIHDAKAMILDLTSDHETIARSLREKIGQISDKYHDVGTEDFLTGLLEEHEKTAWMLRAVLEA